MEVVKGLSKDEIQRAFEELSAELGRAERAHELVILGGAALIMLYEARESTRDVDAIVAGRAVMDASKRIATKIGLPPDWLNDGAKGYVHGLAIGDAVFSSPSLVVKTLAPQQLLAMKLSAWRDDVDIDDARLLLSNILDLRGARPKDEVWSSIEGHLVPGRELKARYAFDDLWEEERGAS